MCAAGAYPRDRGLFGEPARYSRGTTAPLGGRRIVGSEMAVRGAPLPRPLGRGDLKCFNALSLPSTPFLQTFPAHSFGGPEAASALLWWIVAL